MRAKFGFPRTNYTTKSPGLVGIPRPSGLGTGGWVASTDFLLKYMGVDSRWGGKVRKNEIPGNVRPAWDI